MSFRQYAGLNEKYFDDITKCRRNYLNIIIEKYVNTNEPCKDVDITTLKIVKPEGKKRRHSEKSETVWESNCESGKKRILSRFGTLCEYYCESVQKLIEVETQEYLEEIAKYDGENKTACVSTTHLIENRIGVINPKLKSHGQEHIFSQELSASPCSKQKISVCSKRYNHTDDLTPIPYEYKDITLDDFLLSGKHYSEEHNNSIKTANSKQNVHFNFDFEILHRKTFLKDSLSPSSKGFNKRENYFVPPTDLNIFCEGFSGDRKSVISKNKFCLQSKARDDKSKLFIKDINVSIPYFKNNTCKYVSTVKKFKGKENVLQAENPICASEENIKCSWYRTCRVVCHKLDINKVKRVGVTSCNKTLHISDMASKEVNEEKTSLSLTDSNIYSKECKEDFKRVSFKRKSVLKTIVLKSCTIREKSLEEMK